MPTSQGSDSGQQVASPNSGASPSGAASGDLGGLYPSPTVLKVGGDGSGTVTYAGGVAPSGTVPGAYPYAILETDEVVEVDSSQARTVTLPFLAARHVVAIVDAGAQSATHNITVGVPSGKKLNGATDGTATIATNGKVVAFYRRANGDWFGGV